MKVHGLMVYVGYTDDPHVEQMIDGVATILGTPPVLRTRRTPAGQQSVFGLHKNAILVISATAGRKQKELSDNGMNRKRSLYFRPE